MIKIYGISVCYVCRKHVETKTMVSRRCIDCQPKNKWPTCERCNRKIKPMRNGDPGACKWCEAGESKATCEVCDEIFKKESGVDIRRCQKCSAIHPVAAAPRFRRVSARRCDGCGHRVEFSPCVICETRNRLRGDASIIG